MASKPKTPASKKAPATPKDSTGKKLNNREEVFVAALLADEALNAERAAITAGYSAGTARTASFTWVCEDRERCPAGKRHIWDAVQAGKAARLERLEYDGDKLLELMVGELYADIAELYDENDNIKPIHQWPIEFRRGLVVSLDTEELWDGPQGDKVQSGQSRKIRFADRAKRMQMVGNHVKIQAFKENVAVDMGDFAGRLKAARIRNTTREVSK